MIPFILYAALALGHRLFGGPPLNLSPHTMTIARAIEYFWQWFIGSLLLGIIVAALGTAVTYVVARAIRSR
jgi:uncharacterized protein (DUF2062 family)